MEYNLKKLKEELELKRNELNTAIENEESEQKIYQKSVEVDDAIAKLTKANNHYEVCKEQLNEYAIILQTQYKDEIINMIKNEVKEKFKNMKENEVNHFSENLYILCCFEAHKISKDEMTRILMCNNHIFLYESKDEDIIGTNDSLTNLNFYSKLEKKYITIIRERM